MQKISTWLWFDSEAEEAARFYCSVFHTAKMGRITHYGDAGPLPKGTVLTASFTLEGQEFHALNGGPAFEHNPSVSFMVHCDSQKEIDEYWTKLSANPKAEQCGWLQDKYGISWQIVPRKLDEWMKDPAVYNRVMKALMPMKKLDIATLERAAKAA